MVTADNEQAAHHLAMQIGVDKSYTEANPKRKLDVIREWQQQGLKSL